MQQIRHIPLSSFSKQKLPLQQQQQQQTPFVIKHNRSKETLFYNLFMILTPGGHYLVRIFVREEMEIEFRK